MYNINTVVNRDVPIASLGEKNRFQTDVGLKKNDTIQSIVFTTIEYFVFS